MKPDVSQLKSYLQEAQKRIHPILNEVTCTSEVEIDDCIVNRKELEKLNLCCGQRLEGKEVAIKIPLELIITDEFWRTFAKFLKENG